MEKLHMQSADGVQVNIERIASLFPDCVTETIVGYDADDRPILRHKVDFEKLQQNLSSEIISGKEERYQFTWPDKKKAILLANSPINATLRPCRDESVDFDNTKNLYIEGDNLDVLKCLKETYLHKVKMIYIDPPYNTGNDFVYEDDFAESTSEYLANSGQFDEQGRRLVTNTESNGRFHTDWLNMIYPRLKVARDLLTDDGVIFISIDDHEIDNLMKVCNEIFGEQNFIDVFNWSKTETPENLSVKCRQIIEYVLCYQKCKDKTRFKGIQKYSSSSNGLLNQPNVVGTLKFPANTVVTKMSNRSIPAGIYGTDKYVVELLDNVKISDGRFENEFRLRAKFKWQQSYLDKEIANGTIISIPTEKMSPSYEKKEYAPEVPTNLINSKVGVGTNENAGEYQLQLFPKKVFSFPKPTSLMAYLLGFMDTPNEDYIVLDFFSGSASTADAVMRMNVEREMPIRYIMVQIPEELSETMKNVNNPSQKEIIQNAIDLCHELNKRPLLTEVAKERIRRAGKKIKEDNPLTTQNLDTGFRVLKLDSSNMQDVYYSPSDTTQSNIFNLVDNVKEDRTQEDLLFQVMLELGATLDSRIETTSIAGKQIFNVADNYLVACFERDIDDDVVTAIAKMQPQYAVLRDTSMSNDSTATNFEQIFKTYAPNTVTKVL